MTCKDCLSHDICEENKKLMFTTNNLYELMYQEAVEVSCKHFKNKADYAEVKHGEWESFEIPHMMRCSECGVSDIDIHRTNFAFCPYCGSKMDRGKAE